MRMSGLGRVESYLLDKIKREGAVHVTLLDPEKTAAKGATEIARAAKSAGTAAIMVGGSTVAETRTVDEVVVAIKRSGLPVILFPNNLTAISRHADAIWFMSLLNSTNPYFIIGAHCLGAPLVKRYGIEAIPMAYIIVGEGGAAAVVGQATPISFDRPELIASYALAGQYLGMRVVYLEAGSGARVPVPPSVISLTKKFVDIPLVVGGGIRTPKAASEAVRAGASIIVTGTLIEEDGGSNRLKEIIATIKQR